MSTVIASPTPDDPARDYAKDDTRDCPHTCPGTLDRTADDPICSVCHCRPNGVFVPPANNTTETDELKGGYCQSTWFYPTPHVDTNRSTRHRYANSNNMKCWGGYEAVYDENNPLGGTDEYVFDITTL